MVESRRARFSAADFFVVSRNTIFALSYVATTYFIIVVQFRQQYKNHVA